MSSDLVSIPFAKGNKYGMKTKLLLLAGCALLLGFALVIPAFAQQIEPGPACENAEYFPDTRHNVCDQFLKFFNERGGAEIFGYPLTEWFVEDGRLVQYFQRVRMEHHPENPLAYQVQLGLLGDFFAPADKKTPIPLSEKPRSNDRERRYFPETGHTVGYSFLKFYDEKGGLDIFGYPLTEFTVENGRYVQYFQRALMEWRPNRGSIALHNLGEMWIDLHPNLYEYIKPARPWAPGTEPVAATLKITALQVAASVRNAFTSRGDRQTVWVYVYDQNDEPVEGAAVQLVIHYSTGDRVIEARDIPLTDEKGHTQKTFDLGEPAPGRLVVIDANVTYNDLTTQAQTSFFPWW